MDETYVMRTWKRDGSVDLMTLDAACRNLAGNGQLVMGTAIPCLAHDVRKKLLAGRPVETKMARFLMVV